MSLKYNIVYNKCNQSTISILDINKVNWKELQEEKYINFNIDLMDMNKKNLRRVIKAIEKILKKYTSKYEYNFYISNFNENNQNHKDFIKIIETLFLKDIRDRYNFIYDEVCKFLDNEFISKDLCQFRNNKCGEKANLSSEVGCCRHYKNKLIGPIGLKNPLIVCEYLKNKRCSAKCISCKLYTCDYLRRKGIQFKIKNILLLDIFFNPIQKFIIKYSVFTPKEEIIRKLLLFK